MLKFYEASLIEWIRLTAPKILRDMNLNSV